MLCGSEGPGVAREVTTSISRGMDDASCSVELSGVVSPAERGDGEQEEEEEEEVDEAAAGVGSEWVLLPWARCGEGFVIGGEFEGLRLLDEVGVGGSSLS